MEGFLKVTFGTLRKKYLLEGVVELVKELVGHGTELIFDREGSV